MSNFERVGVVTKRRYLTVLFSDLSGSSELAESMEAEDLSSVLEDLRRVSREVISRHGGHIARIQGDGLLAIFGFPSAMEDDGRRACEAALDLHRAVALLTASKNAALLSLKMHSGIHAGLVLLTEGDIERGRFDVVGEVPNTAARLCSVASVDEICVSMETLGPQSHFFQHSQPKQLELRGRGSPLTVTFVNGRSSVNRRFEAAAMGGFGRFVGREDTLSNLTDLLQQTVRGKPSAIVVSGEPGIGKTRLLDEFQRRVDAQTFEVLHGYCESYLNAEPMQPFLQIARSALGWKVGASSEQFLDIANAKLLKLGSAWSETMRPLVQSMLPKQESTEQPSGARNYAQLILQLIEALAKKRPLLLVLDDWQWADDASRHALDGLLAMHIPLMVLLAARPVGTGDEVAFGVPILQLSPFVEIGRAHV